MGALLSSLIEKEKMLRRSYQIRGSLRSRSSASCRLTRAMINVSPSSLSRNSPHRTAPRLPSPRLTSPHLTSRHLTPFQLTPTPRLSNLKPAFMPPGEGVDKPRTWRGEFQRRSRALHHAMAKAWNFARNNNALERVADLDSYRGSSWDRRSEDGTSWTETASKLLRPLVLQTAHMSTSAHRANGKKTLQHYGEHRDIYDLMLGGTMEALAATLTVAPRSGLPVAIVRVAQAREFRELRVRDVQRSRNSRPDFSGIP